VLYTYCLNNPLKYIDPSGYKFLKRIMQLFRRKNKEQPRYYENEFFDEESGGSYMPIGSGFSYIPQLTFQGGIPFITGYDIYGGTLPDVVIKSDRNNLNTTSNFTYTNHAFTFSDVASSGGLTWSEAKAHYQFGEGTPVHVQLSSLDLSKVSMADFNERGLATIRLDTRHFSSTNDALVHGSITLQLIPGTNQAKIALNSGRDSFDNWINSVAV